MDKQIRIQKSRIKYGKIVVFFLLMVIYVGFVGLPVYAQESFEVTGKCIEGQKVTLEININDETNIDGFDIYRADSASGIYQYIGSLETEGYKSAYYYDDIDYEVADYTYTDSAVLTLYQTYYYRVQAYQYLDEEKVCGQFIDTEVLIVGSGPEITYAKRNGKFGSKLKWTPVADADGYLIYCMKDYDDNGNSLSVNRNDETEYELVKTIEGNSTFSASFKKLTNGVTYTYRIYSYKNINGRQIPSISSKMQEITMDYYAYAGEDYYQKVKRAYGSAKAQKKNFSTAMKASKQMKTIKIKVWDFKNGRKGKKVTKVKSLTVNKRLAPTIQQIFKEIYESREKQVIHDIGCYSYREGEHMHGLAIDVNPNENYMIDGKKVLAGRYWKPKKDPYSIPNDSEFVKIMNKYGFMRGAWGKRKDYMHFSYFGT